MKWAVKKYRPESQELDRLSNEIAKMTTQLYDEFTKERERILEFSVREFSDPKITGNITKGKLSWRGIKLINQQGVEWLEQRGERISPKIKPPTFNF